MNKHYHLSSWLLSLITGTVALEAGLSYRFITVNGPSTRKGRPVRPGTGWQGLSESWAILIALQVLS